MQVRSFAAAFCLLILTLATACRQTPPPEAETLTPPPAQPYTEEIRQLLQKRNPDAMIGRVIAVLPEESLAAVAELDASRFRPGDSVQFFGTEDVELGFGRVVQVLSNAIHVRYDAPTDQRRAPVVGDLVIWFPKR
jgi:hypothetical protein